MFHLPFHKFIYNYFESLPLKVIKHNQSLFLLCLPSFAHSRVSNFQDSKVKLFYMSIFHVDGGKLKCTHLYFNLLCYSGKKKTGGRLAAYSKFVES